MLDGLPDRLGAPVRLIALEPWALRSVVLRLFDVEVADAAADGLWREQPVMSARIVLARGQRIVLLAALVVVAASLLAAPRLTGTVPAASRGRLALAVDLLALLEPGVARATAFTRPILLDRMQVLVTALLHR